MTVHRPISAAAMQVEEIAQVIGQQNVTRLCQAFGGTKIYVPRLIGPKHPIALAVGMKVAALLAEYYDGLYLDLPKANARRERMIEMALSGSMTIQEAALACDYTERRLYQLLAERKQDDGQLDLFA